MERRKKLLSRQKNVQEEVKGEAMDTGSQSTSSPLTRQINVQGDEKDELVMDTESGNKAESTEECTMQDDVDPTVGSDSDSSSITDTTVCTRREMPHGISYSTSTSFAEPTVLDMLSPESTQSECSEIPLDSEGENSSSGSEKSSLLPKRKYEAEEVHPSEARPFKRSASCGAISVSNQPLTVVTTPEGSTSGIFGTRSSSVRGKKKKGKRSRVLPAAPTWGEGQAEKGRQRNVVLSISTPSHAEPRAEVPPHHRTAEPPSFFEQPLRAGTQTQTAEEQLASAGASSGSKTEKKPEEADAANLI